METSGAQFEKFIGLQAHSVELSLVQKAYAFIHDVCELVSINMELLERVISICLVNSFAADTTTSSGRECLNR